tara:strand:+ start:473 stop:601 length:129 start_codon:yes stop_codon:yes gene_type:complete
LGVLYFLSFQVELNNKLSEKDLAANKMTNEINKGKESGVDKE